jgi:two-component system, OmpR family, sensor kinase
MSTLRARLTATYTAALIGTMAAFTIALWAARRSGAYAELERTVATEASLAINIIRQAELAGQQVTIERDPIVGPTISPALRTLLEVVPDYVLVLDPSGRSLFVSYQVRQLDMDSHAALQQAAIAAPADGTPQVVNIGQQNMILVALAPGSTQSAISRVAAASPTAPADAAVSQFVTTSLAIAPFLIVASVMVAWAIAGRAFRPIDLIINDVQAITDGRSLHRRLPEVRSGDELARLTFTLNEMLARLEKSFGALRRFTADASHELKTPLAVLRADVERAMHPDTATPDRLVALEEALHETTRMADLVDSLLTLARADEGRFDLHREPVALEPLVQEVFETALILGEAAGLTVTLPEVEPATCMGDRTRLRQLFLNLATNAIKYTSRGGSVEIALNRSGSMAEFTVRDTGIGIPAGDLPHVFERFYRADRARSRSSERAGFGLGLAISRWIAEAHGGGIAVRSRLGRGSTFTVTLPVVGETEQAETAVAMPV